MISRIALLATAVAAAPLARAAEPECSVRASGAVGAAFACKVSVLSTKNGGIAVAFTPGRLPRNVGAFLAGPFEIPGPIAPGTYTLPILRSGRMMLSGPRHATYAAEAGPRARGDVTFALGVANAAAGSATAAGTLTARLVPTSRKGRGSVVVTVRFAGSARSHGAAGP
jgi:hypothetical protein